MAEGGEPGRDYDQEDKGLSENDLTMMAQLLTKSGKFQVLYLGGAGAEQEDTPHKQQGAVSPELVRPKQPNYVPPVPAQGFMSSTPGYGAPSFQFPSLQQPPRISIFSGEEPTPKGEVGYEVWHYDVKCLQRDPVYAPSVILQTIRRSLKGTASRVLLAVGEMATVEQILAKFDSIYGNVFTGESILQQFYTERQRDGETVAAWACRLEDLLHRAVERGYVSHVSRNDMLKNKFWTGLAGDKLKNATRHKFDTLSDFDLLLREVRQVEQETTGSDRLQKRANQHAANVESQPSQSSITDLCDRLQGMMKRMDAMERRLDQQARPAEQRQQPRAQPERSRGRPWRSGGGRGRPQYGRAPPDEPSLN